MKLVTFEVAGAQYLGALVRDDAAILDVQASYRRRANEDLPALTSMQALINSGEDGLAIISDLLGRHDVTDIKTLNDQVQLCAPLPLPVQIRDCMCFEQHLTGSAEAVTRASGQPMSDRHKLMHQIFKERPIYYKANRFATAGTRTTIAWPAYSKTMDYELEMGCVLGRRGKNISRSEASSFIFGFTIFNDLSARDTQGHEMLAGLGPTKSKDFDNANIFGPCIVTADSFDPYDAVMTVRVNGETRSVGSSSTMTYKFEDLISFISCDETLYPGEILCSGTVGGGCGLEQGKFLASGDELELEIEGIGILHNRIIATA